MAFPPLTGLVADAGKLRRLSCSQGDFIYFLLVTATSLELASKSTSLSSVFSDVIKAARYDLLRILLTRVT